MSDLMILKPRLSEKSYGLSQTSNTYVFDVPASVSKLSVASAVADQYKVEVINVNVANVGGKSKRTFLNRRGKFVRGTRQDIKKAYITLKKGDTLPIFAAEEEAEAKQEETQKKVEKAMEKQAKKEEKKSSGSRFKIGGRAPKRTSIRGNK